MPSHTSLVSRGHHLSIRVPHSGGLSTHDLSDRHCHTRPLCAVCGRVFASSGGTRNKSHLLRGLRPAELPVQLPPRVPDVLLVRVRGLCLLLVHIRHVRIVRLLVREHVSLLPLGQLRLLVQLRGTAAMNQQTVSWITRGS